MIERKFRAWDKENEKMAYDSIFWNIQGNYVYMLSPHHLQSLYIRLDSGRFEIMQSTGLLDSKGIEIYESDVVTYLFEGRKCTEIVEIKNGLLSPFYETYAGQGHQINEMKEIEVIGNIYQNPELLKK